MKKNNKVLLTNLSRRLTALLDIAPLNAHVQTSLSDVFRWGSVRESWWRCWLFSDRRLRKQSDLQHSYAMTILLQWAIAKLAKHNPDLDRYLVICCGADHDLGEGETKNDVCALTKRREVDVREYFAFRKVIDKFDLAVREDMARAFLLQFADVNKDQRVEDWALFPSEAQDILEWLAENRRLEARIFRYLERLEYILYAIEQANLYGNFHLAAEVTSKNAGYVFISHQEDMERACQLIPGFREEIWTLEIQETISEFIQAYNQKAAP